MLNLAKRYATLEDFLALGMAVSVLLHIGLVALLSHRPARRLPEVMMVDFVMEQPAAALKTLPPPLGSSERQIITPPERSEAAPPKETRLLSDQDSFAEKEQVRRGEGLEAGPVVGPGAAGSRGGAPAAEAQPVRPPAQPSARAGKTAEPARKKLDLALDMNTVGQIIKQGAAGARPGAAQHTPNPQPFSRAPGSGAQFLGVNGFADYLPNLPDGDITLLNAKAEKFAVFVRRVATQVFYQIKLQGWELLRADDIRHVKEFTVVRAVLSPQGALLRTSLEGRSGSVRFDDNLESAVRKGARDPHPPPDGAAADGNFHFIFMARSWVQLSSDPRSGFPREQRWLLLKTGLE